MEALIHDMKMGTGLLQHLPDAAAYLSLPSSFQNCSHSTALPPLASAVGWTQHHFAEFRGMAPYKWLWLLEALWNWRTLAQEEFVPHFFLSTEVSMYKSITSPLDSALLETRTVTQRNFGSRKEKLQNHWVLKRGNIYQALRMETCQGEAFLWERKADLPKRERCFPHPPSPPLKKASHKLTADISPLQNPQSLVPFHHPLFLQAPSSCVAAEDLLWGGLPWLTVCRVLLELQLWAELKGIQQYLWQKTEDFFCDNPHWWQVS